MKKLIIGFLSFFLLTSTAYASINGTYKNNQIIRLTSNGTALNVSDVPAMLFQGRTLVPIYLLQQIGLEVNYDAQTMTVDVKVPNSTTSSGLTLSELNKIGDSVGIIYAYADNKYVGQGSGFVVDNVLVTNWHVVDGGATRFVATFEDKQKTIQVSDALFKNESADLIGFAIESIPGLKLNADGPNHKEKVYTLGFPHGKFRITEGEVLIKNNNLGIMTHSAETKPGNSGGVVINENGKVVGVTKSGDNDYNNAIMLHVLQEELNKLK